MVVLTDKKQRVYASDPSIGIATGPIKATVNIKEGALLTHTGGYIRPLATGDTAANYVGIALEDVVGGAADGDAFCTYTRLVEEEVDAWEGTPPTIASVTGAVAVYAGDDSGGDANSDLYNLDGTGRIKVAEVSGYNEATGKFRIRHVTALRR